MSTSRKKILVFLVLTFGFSSVFYYLIISAGSLGAYSGYLMWCLGLAGILTQLIFQRNLRDMGWRPGPAKYLLWGFGLPLLYCAIVYGIVWLTGLGKFNTTELVNTFAKQFHMEGQSPAKVLAIYGVLVVTYGIAMSAFRAFGEEIGWKGLLVPALAKETCSYTKTALISAAIWTIWHYPPLLFSDYNNAGAPIWFGLICFTIMVFGINFVSVWLRLKTGSIWPAMLLHSSHNLFVQTVFTPLTSDTGITAYVIDEFGVGLAIAFVVLGFVFWRKRSELSQYRR